MSSMTTSSTLWSQNSSKDADGDKSTDSQNGSTSASPLTSVGSAASDRVVTQVGASQ